MEGQMKAQTPETPGGMVCRGELVLRQITTLKADLKAALDHVDALLIDFTEARALEPSFLQLLCRGHRAMDELKKARSQADPEADGLPSGAHQGGFFRHVGCMLECQDSCLWTHE
jgi:hypothetical protein